MNSLVKYMIWGECNIIIETVTSMNKVHDDMNFMVKYMIWGEVNITIDTENFMNKVNGVMNFLVKYMIGVNVTSPLITDGIPKLLDPLVFRINARSQLKIEASITF